MQTKPNQTKAKQSKAKQASKQPPTHPPTQPSQPTGIPKTKNHPNNKSTANVSRRLSRRSFPGAFPPGVPPFPTFSRVYFPLPGSQGSWGPRPLGLEAAQEPKKQPGTTRCASSADGPDANPQGPFVPKISRHAYRKEVGRLTLGILLLKGKLIQKPKRQLFGKER